MKKISLLSFLSLIFGLCGCKKDQIPYPVQSYKDTTFTDYFKRTTGLIAADGAYSIPLSNGKSLWVFGDSYIDSYDSTTNTTPCLFQARNSCLLIDVANPSQQTTLPGNFGSNSFFVDGSDNYIWPGSGFQQADTIYVFVNKLWHTQQTDTSMVAKILYPSYALHSFFKPADFDGINFGVSIIQETDFDYVYGIKHNGFGHDVYAARFPHGNIAATWQFYNGDSWVADATAANRIHEEFTASFYLLKLKSKYVLITTEFSVGCDQGKNIYVATSDNPTGPFENKHSVWQIDDYLQGHLPFFYLANAHPEFDNGNEELLITYCINNYGDCVETCISGRQNPDNYRPKAIRVAYNSIHPDL